MADPGDFHPALIRLQEAPPSPLGRMVLWVLLMFLALLLAWSFVGRLDIVAVADGKLVPASYLKIVQPAEAGVVKEILVREGEAVGEKVGVRVLQALGELLPASPAPPQMSPRLSVIGPRRVKKRSVTCFTRPRDPPLR
jgi:hypothetical protein